MILLFISLIGNKNTNSQQVAKSNESVLKSLTETTLDEFFEGIALKENDTLYLKLEDDNNKKFLNNHIIDLLTNKKKYILILAENIDKNFLECFINKLSVVYSTPFREKFLGRKKIFRNIEIEYSLKFIRDNQIISYRPISMTYTDTIDYEQVEYIENKMIPMTISVVPEDSFYEKYVIPIITVSTLSLIVYLFFTIRK